MNTIISLLRGINVSGRKSIKMEALRKSYESIGLQNVVSYIQSGNIIFTCEDSDLHSLEKRLSSQIRADFDFDVPVFLLSVDKLGEIIKNCPFKEEVKKSPSALYVTILKSEPKSIISDSINNKRHEKEKIYFLNDIIYLFCPNGYGKTKLNNSLFEKELKTDATTRNWNTLNKLFAIAIKTKKDRS